MKCGAAGVDYRQAKGIGTCITGHRCITDVVRNGGSAGDLRRSHAGGVCGGVRNDQSIGVLRRATGGLIVVDPPIVDQAWIHVSGSGCPGTDRHRKQGIGRHLECRRLELPNVQSKLEHLVQLRGAGWVEWRRPKVIGHHAAGTERVDYALRKIGRLRMEGSCPRALCKRRGSCAKVARRTWPWVKRQPESIGRRVYGLTLGHLRLRERRGTRQQ